MTIEYDGYPRLSQHTDAEEKKIDQFQGQGQSETDKISKKDVLLVIENWDTKVPTVEEEMQPVSTREPQTCICHFQKEHQESFYSS